MKYLPAEARLDKAIANAIIEYLNQCRDVVAAYLFGSCARGTGRERSDIDVAVLFAGSEGKLHRFDRRLEIIMDLERVTGKKVDVIDIQAAPLLLQHQIIKDGILLVDKDPRYRVGFEVWSRRTYFDLQPLLERRNKKFIAKVLERGMMVDMEVIRHRLALLSEYIADLEAEKDVGLKEFLADKRLRRYIERTLHLAVGDWE
ncbi:type VII toxin-antitoxin system MntA family adenylyltransferase antitoxin [Neomoorella humiferrea]|uniref:Nucleotidyltransferase domain protein n=2 Tax=Neomoorella humiferrea TaxID=676965 RepID=A0A2T0AV70_9FIRM|nr:nucleotidyltransferase domain-containing protein [Moorella humiferrea]PRR74269.1 Nucleotidyltransferase domain protein [Moorella humiferrea]